MSGRFLLDTNIVIALFAADKTVLNSLNEASETFVSAVVLGELYFGACKSARAAENLARLDEFATASAVIGCGVETARWYGKIKCSLREAGRPIPENDIWLAAAALEHKLTLVTRDEHFDSIAELDHVRW